jgi:hypothetical protein
MSVRPLVLGPDLRGHRVIVAGDRVAHAGPKPPPRMPGARELAVGEALLGPAPLAVLPPLRSGADPSLLVPVLLRAGSCGALLALRDPDPDLERALTAMQVFARAGLRLVLGHLAGDQGSRAAEATERLFAHARSALARVVLWVAPGDAVARAAAEDAALATGMAVLPFPPPDPAAAASRAFGRRLARLEPGAGGDVAARSGEGRCLLLAVAGRILVPEEGPWPESRAR